MNRINFFKQTSFIIDSLLKKQRQKKGYEYYYLLKKWEEDNALDFVKKAYPRRFLNYKNRMVLELYVFNSSDMFDLNYQNDDIKDYINKIFNYNIIDDVRFLLDSEEKKNCLEFETSNKKIRDIKATNLIDEIEDENIRSSLRKITNE